MKKRSSTSGKRGGRTLEGPIAYYGFRRPGEQWFPPARSSYTGYETNTSDSIGAQVQSAIAELRARAGAGEIDATIELYFLAVEVSKSFHDIVPIHEAFLKTLMPYTTRFPILLSAKDKKTDRQKEMFDRLSVGTKAGSKHSPKARWSMDVRVMQYAAAIHRTILENQKILCLLQSIGPADREHFIAVIQELMPGVVQIVDEPFGWMNRLITLPKISKVNAKDFIDEFWRIGKELFNQAIPDFEKSDDLQAIIGIQESGKTARRRSLILQRIQQSFKTYVEAHDGIYQ